MPDSCLGPVCEYIHLLSQWLKIHLLPFGPLFTPLVASVAGAIALYSIHVTRSVAMQGCGGILYGRLSSYHQLS